MPGFIMGVLASCVSVQLEVSRLAAQLRTPVTSVVIMLGIRDTIPVKRMIEMPLPTPNSVICSPNHMRNTAPAVKETTITMAAQIPSLVSRP